ncbi:hypothetical protein [Carboxylicivirga marina]|uniref:Uncharacterized protein n=1 Tax=Carboxylicivirga marina TaxID=2800988 RepID=A0ABS1HPL0_9BACT|nr:hypothetical protein [Carboxylicivirga marina]MBK3519624.1 hypothetical protein [Carboxylicivirga marina]
MTRLAKRLTLISVITISLLLLIISLFRLIKLKIELKENNGNIEAKYVLRNKILFDDVIEYFPNERYKEVKFIFLNSNDTISFKTDAFKLQKYSDNDYQFAVPVNWTMNRNDSTVAYVDHYYLTQKNHKVKYKWVLTKDSLMTQKNSMSKIINLKKEVSDINDHIFNEVFDLSLGIYSVLYSYKSNGINYIRYISANTDNDNTVFLVTFETKELYFHLFKNMIEEMDLNTFVYSP